MAYKKTNNKVATYGEQSDSVMELQKQLNAKGASLAVDGKYGDLTKAAFEKFNSASQPTTPSTIPVGAISGEIKPLELAPKAPMTRMQQLLDNEAQNAISGLTGAQQKVAGQESQYSDILKALGTEQQFTNKQLDEQGVTAGQKRLAELQALAMRETNNLTSSILRNESNAIGTRETANFLGSQEARMRRESAINSLAIASEAAMVQGQTELAQANVDRMVKAVYEPMKMELEAARFNLSRLDKNVLEPAQRAKAEATERKLNYELKQVEKQQSFADTLFKNGAPPSLIKEVLNTNSLEEAMQVKGAGDYTMSPAEKLDMKLKNIQIAKVSFDLNQARSEAAQAKEDRAKGLLSIEQYKQATELRKEYNGLTEVKNAKDSVTSTTGLLNSLAQKTPTSDIAAINSFQRLAVDPGVSVKEGDVALLQSANSFGDKAWLRTNGYLQGNKLTDKARQDMQALALKIHDARVDYTNEQTLPIRSTAQGYNIDFDKYVGTPFAGSSEIVKKVTSQQLPPKEQVSSYVADIKKTLEPQFGPTSVQGTPFQSLFAN